MNIESVKSLFSLFSGEENVEKYMPFISLAVSETEKMLVDGADSSDVRLDFLSAASANYRLALVNAARDRSESTYAGKISSAAQENSTVKYAEKMLMDYINLCGGLIKSGNFVFMSFGKGVR